VEVSSSPAAWSVKSFYNQRLGRWFFCLVAIAFLLSIPLITIALSVFEPFSDTWRHLASTVLPSYITHSLLLMLGVAVGTFTLGVSCAWFTCMYAFPGRKVLEWALLLPMAMPAYIIAYAYTGALDFAGPIQTAIRDTFDVGYGDYWFPEIRSLGGAVVMFSLVLYPYVYLIVRAAFMSQSHAILEVSRSLGNGPWRTFYAVALPAARPAIVAGMTLALMETLADYGTVQYFGVSTFTTGIFRTWFGLGDLTAAAQLSSFLLFFVVLLIVIERISRKQMQFHHLGQKRAYQRATLTGSARWLCFIVCALPLLFGFILPAIQLCLWVIETWHTSFDAAFFILVQHSISLAAVAAILCVLLAVIVCFSARLTSKSRLALFFLRVSTLGYAVPGTVIAVGVLIPLAALDNGIDNWLRSNTTFVIGLVFSGTLFAVIVAYIVRFLSVSVQSIEAGFSQIHTSIDDSARTLGRKPLGVLLKVHLPMLKTSLIAAGLLVFVDVMKELPTTLILRPFNFNTLAVRAYELASDERLADAATPAIAIVLTGLIPVFLLFRTMRGASKSH